MSSGSKVLMRTEIGMCGGSNCMETIIECTTTDYQSISTLRRNWKISR